MAQKKINSQALSKIVKSINDAKEIIEQKNERLQAILEGDFFEGIDEMDESNEDSKQPLIYGELKSIFDEMKQLSKNIQNYTNENVQG